MDDQQFYVTAAQVIPIILVALVIEDNWMTKTFDRGRSADRLGLLAILFLGEMTALAALLKAPPEISKYVILIAVGYGFLDLLLPVLIPLTRKASPRRGRWGFVVLFVGSFVVVTIAGSDAVPYLAIAIFLALLLVSLYLREPPTGVSPTVSRTEPENAEPSATEESESQV